MNNNLLLKKDLSSTELAMVQSELNSKGKSKGIAYALWWFLGGIGGHRYYTGDVGIGIGMTLTLGGFGIWSLIDAFLIGKRIEQVNEKIEYDAIQTVIALRK